MSEVSLPVYRGPFGAQQAERLLWRAGFGPRRGEAEAVAKLGLDRAVLSLTRPGRERLAGPAPTDAKGQPIAPLDSFGHDHLWWLDRMVRTSRPLVERMALVWHDWFATSNFGVGSQRLMLRQNQLLRRHSLGSFRDLLLGVTKDPAMLVWLNGAENTPWAPNENYAREVMELFTLGAGRGYSEGDVREQARALTGWRRDIVQGVGPTNFRYDPSLHDPGVKRVFGQSGRFDWQDSCRLCLENPSHPSFLVAKLWSYFVPTAPDAATQRSLESLYTGGGYRVRPVLEAILRHPDFYEGPRMVKPPVVYTAGLLRALGRGVDTDQWFWMDGLAGQLLFYPPSVAGWDDGRWLDTSSFRARWNLVTTATRPYLLTKTSAPSGEPVTPAAILGRALDFWGRPTISQQVKDALLGVAMRSLADADTGTKRTAYPVLAENALRQLIAVSPDFQTA